MKRFLIICLSITTVAALVYCSKIGKAKIDNSTVKTLIVGTSADNPPYEFLAQQQLAGIDIDIVNQIANKLGYKIEIRNLDFLSLIPNLQSGNIDIAIAGLTPTPERSNYVDFSIPYLSAKLAVIYGGNIGIINNLTDLAGRKIGVQTGTPQEQIVGDLAKTYPDIIIRSLSSNLLLLEELKNGNLDVVILEKYQSKAFAASTSFKQAEFDHTFDLAVAVAKSNPLLSAINGALRVLMTPSDDGESQIDQICDRYLYTN